MTLFKKRVQESPADASVVAMQRKFVDLCVAAAPPSITLKRMREFGAPTDFVRLCNHPLVTKVLVEGSVLLIGTKVLSIYGKPIGAYAISIMTGHAPTVSCFNLSMVVKATNGEFHGPHVSGQQGKICMSTTHVNELMRYIKGGELTEATFFIIDALQQTNGNHFIAVESWPDIETGGD